MRVFTAAVAIATGLVILLGYFFPALAELQTLLLNWAIILAGVAALVTRRQHVAGRQVVAVHLLGTRARRLGR